MRRECEMMRVIGYLLVSWHVLHFALVLVVLVVLVVWRESRGWRKKSEEDRLDFGRMGKVVWQESN